MRGCNIESGDILNCSIPSLSSVIIWIWLLFWLISLILSLSNLCCVSFNTVSIGVESCKFDFAVFIGVMKGWFGDFAEYDHDDGGDDKVEEKVEENIIFFK